MDEVLAWWQSEERQRRLPTGVSDAQVRAVFQHCAEHRPSDIEAAFAKPLTLGAWMQRVGWGPLRASSVAVQAQRFESAQEQREVVEQRVLNMTSGATKARRGAQQSLSLEEREAKEVEAAWVGWERVAAGLWLHKGVPKSTIRGAVPAWTRTWDGSECEEEYVGGWAEESAAHVEASHASTRAGGPSRRRRATTRGKDGPAAASGRSRPPAIHRAWAALTNPEKAAAALLGFTQAAWIARDAAPLHELGLNRRSAGRCRMSTEARRALRLLGWPDEHVFQIYRTDQQAPPQLSESQVFVTVKHSRQSVAEASVPVTETVSGFEAVFQCRPPEGDSPRRSGTVWQQGYLPSNKTHDEPPRAARLVDHGQEPRLWEAAVHGQAELLRQILREVPPDLVQPTSGRTALHLAAAADQIDAVALLIRAGASLDARDRDHGQTALHMCCSVEVAKLLIRFGARSELLDRDGVNAFARLQQRSPAVAEAVKPQLMGTNLVWSGGRGAEAGWM